MTAKKATNLRTKGNLPLIMLERVIMMKRSGKGGEETRGGLRIVGRS